MTIAVDSNVLFDLLIDSDHSASSRSSLDRERRTSQLVLSEPVYAEIAAYFPSTTPLHDFLRDLAIVLIPSDPLALYAAGVAWREYARRRRAFVCTSCGTRSDPTCPSCGVRLGPRQHIVADFIIGAHAMANGGALITRDRGFYRSYFKSLRIVSR